MAQRVPRSHDADPGAPRKARTPVLRRIGGGGTQLWSFGWAERRQIIPHLASMAVFAGCKRRQLWRIAGWGDVIEAAPGEVLCREDRSNHWFFVILAGSVRVTRHRQHVATLHRGGHFGEIAVLGFRLQPATVTATEPTLMLVLSRRQLISLAATDRSIQRALFPDVEMASYRDFVRELQRDGRPEWERLKRSYSTGSALKSAGRPPLGRRLSLTEAAEQLTRRDITIDGASASESALLEQRTVRRWPRVVGIVVVFLSLAVFASAYHPPFAVVVPGRPIDVVRDITITGTDVDAPTGRYLLTPVNVSRRNLAGTLVSRIVGRRVNAIRAPEETGSDGAAEARRERETFRNSHRQAIELAERSLGVDPKGITIVIRDRGIGGPSAGLTYALAIIDMLDPADLAAGRVIAATGELNPNGRVSSVGLVSMKADVARVGGADVFFVPAAQKADVGGERLSVIGVKDLAEAVTKLRQRP